MGLRSFKYYLLLPLLSSTKSINNEQKRRDEKNKVRKINKLEQNEIYIKHKNSSEAIYKLRINQSNNL